MPTIGIFSGKGGVGKTTITANLAATLVKYFAKKVLIVDGNITTPNLGLHYGIIDVENDILKAMRGEISVKDCIYLHPSGIHIIPASVSEIYLEDFEPRFKEIINPIKNFYDFILIDGAAGISLEVRNAIRACDYCLLITLPDRTSVVSMVKAKRVINNIGVPIIGVIINMVGRNKEEMSKEDIESISDLRVLAEIPYDKLILDEVKKMKPAVLLKSKGIVVERFKVVASSLIGEYYVEKLSFLDKLKKIFRLWKK